jgi:hypothetical protein
VTNPASAGKMNANVQPWTLPIEISSENEMALTIQQSSPRVLAWPRGNRCLSKNEPIITMTVPTSSEEMKVADKAPNSRSCVFSKLCFSDKAARNTPPTFKIAPIGNSHLDTLNPPPSGGNSVYRFDGCCKQALHQLRALAGMQRAIHFTSL